MRFRTEVVRVERAADFARSGRWRVLTHATDAPQGEVVEHTFDAVMVCIGHHARPYVPEFKGVRSTAPRTYEYVLVLA